MKWSVHTLTERIKVRIVFGTSPEAVKMARLVKELKRCNKEFEKIVTITAQHREMLDQVVDIFKIELDLALTIMKEGHSLAKITSRVLDGLDVIMKETKPDIVLSHGDTSTTFSASLAAFSNQ